MTTDWGAWRKCQICGVDTGQACRSLSGHVAGGRPDGISSPLLEPHSGRRPRRLRTEPKEGR